jgi:N-acetylmuramoyl-L-alanine amidase
MSLEEAMRLIDDRPGWEGEYPPIVIPRHPAEKYLKDVTIVLDPGHGASDGKTDPTYKRGPTREREDDMNLRVGLLLHRLLKDAGANVILTRDRDMLLDLPARSEIANTAPRPDGGTGADLFISIHHNAVNNPHANYTSVWYHGEVDDAEAAIDAALPIAHRLGQAMRTDVAKTSPILSDQLMYGTGFGVLRGCNMPAILLECSFYTHPQEEQRLRDAGYNLREAYAVYVGLCEWAYGGRPTQAMPEANLQARPGFLVLQTVLQNGLPDWWGKDRNRILQSTIQVTVDGRRVDHTFDPVTRQLRVDVPIEANQPGAVTADRFELTIKFANMFKHHNHPQRFEVSLDRQNMTASLRPLRVKQAVPPATQPK